MKTNLSPDKAGVQNYIYQYAIRDIACLSHRHLKYGVQDYHYEKVGEALLWTLEQGLGKNWTAETRDAWIACYTLLSGAMKEMSQEVSI